MGNHDHTFQVTFKRQEKPMYDMMQSEVPWLDLMIAHIPCCVIQTNSLSYWKMARNIRSLLTDLNHHILQSQKNFIKIINKESPVFLQDLIPKRIGDIRPQSRYPDNLYTVKSRIDTFRQSFIPSAVNLWNSLKGSDSTLTYADSLLKKA